MRTIVKLGRPRSGAGAGVTTAREGAEEATASVGSGPQAATRQGGARGRATRWPRSIRTRILVAHLGVLLVATVASIVVVRQVMLSRLDQRIDTELVQETDELRRLAAGRDPASGEPFGQNVARIFEVYLRRNVPSRHESFVSFLGGEPFLRSPPDPPYHLEHDLRLVAAWATLREPDRGSVQTPAGRVEYLAVPLLGTEEDGVFVVASFRDAQQSEANDLVWAAGAVGLAVLLIGSLLAWRLADRVLGPVEAVTTTARRISEGDLTERIDVAGQDEIAALANTFNDMLDRLQSAFTQQRRFVADTGHELKTPLTIVRGHLELLGTDPKERQDTLELVTDELARMSRIVNDLQMLARWEQPDFLQIAPVEVGALTDDLFAKATALAERDWRLEARAEGQILADSQRLTQAVVQLAENAVQHTPSDTPISIGSALTDHELRLWVRDQGAGIDRTQQSRIFERFYRSRRTGSGSGLGLSIVDAIARAHHGRVQLDSRPGAGALFTLILPSRKPETGLP